MDLNNIRNEIKDLAAKAVQYDKLEKYEEAQEYYVKAADKLNLLIKYDESPYNKEVYIKKAKEYCERAKTLKEASAKPKEKTKEEKADEETKKLQEQLSNCLVTETPNVKWDSRIRKYFVFYFLNILYILLHKLLQAFSDLNPFF